MRRERETERERHIMLKGGRETQKERDRQWWAADCARNDHKHHVRDQKPRCCVQPALVLYLPNHVWHAKECLLVKTCKSKKKNKGVEAPRGRLVKSCQLVKESLIEKSSKDPIGEGTDPKP